MKKCLFFAISTILLVTSYGQISSPKKTENLPKFYFYTIYYGYTGDAYVSEVYELEIDRSDLYKTTKQRYENGISFLTENKIIASIQTGLEKNYLTKEQAENERNYYIDQLSKSYKVTSYKFQ